jgi:hypothetical protein
LGLFGQDNIAASKLRWGISHIPEMVSGECFSHPFHKRGALQMGNAFDLDLKAEI